MTTIEFVDTTLRDGHHSLWAQGMRTGMMLPIAPDMDAIGFSAVEVIGSGHFRKCVKELKENPWERIRLMRGQIKKTPLTFMMLPSVTTFDRTPYSVLRLYIERLVYHGIRRFNLMEPSNDLTNRVPETVRFIRQAGAKLAIALVYSISPRHTDEYYVAKAKDALRLSPDSFYLKDPSGLLTPERVKTLVPALLAAAPDIPFELHSHCTTGLAPVCYIEAIRLGVRIVHTAIPPLADGSSQPSVLNVVRNARLLGFDVCLDEERIQSVAQHFARIAEAENLAVGMPVSYDVSQYVHHVPGGVISHLRHQLNQLGKVHLLDRVLEEIGQVRSEFGYPIMVTPFSQFVCSLASLNVILGERYKQVPDEVILYALGRWGTEAASRIEPSVRDRILDMPRAKELGRSAPTEPEIDEVRQQLGGAGLSDDDLILRYIAPANEVAAMYAAGPPRFYAPAANRLLSLLSKLAERNDIAQVQVRYGKEFSVSAS